MRSHEEDFSASEAFVATGIGVGDGGTGVRVDVGAFSVAGSCFGCSLAGFGVSGGN
jgi:hypothetical protein